MLCLGERLKIIIKNFESNILYLQGVEVVRQNGGQPKNHQTIRMMNSIFSKEFRNS